MQTNFTLAQLADPATAEADKILRACVHCGFCTATCPTFALLGDELDSPRGRIYLIKEMLEHGRPADAETVKHIDRCLSCLACMTTCPSGVNYMHLVDQARTRIEDTYQRPLTDRLIRAMLAFVLPYPRRFAFALRGAGLAAPLAQLFARCGEPGRRIAAMLRLARAPTLTQLSPPALEFPAAGAIAPSAGAVARVAILQGCAQKVLRPQTNAATIRLLARLGVESVLVEGEACCGALLHHLGDEAPALEQVRRNVDVWTAEIETKGLDAIIITASGCGTMIKDYGYLLRLDPAYADKAARVAALARDVTEFLGGLAPPPPRDVGKRAIAYHSACSMQHGQKIDALPKKLLAEAGFDVRSIPEGHLCCGSAGTYNILQPELALLLRERKIVNILKTSPDCVATGNIGCITQIASGLDLPVVHTVELLDYAYGGPKPTELP
ncbi:heterodisulfide reductase-related iron-sulfur binding cluster [Methylocapsa palsarum]|uniref:Glycolate oxidase iron-sulfur subunit n=1 Tax=Methylocapsa palsarum TaxID=1612308 RepID=A0A1I3VXP3_9HYPH|nr:heterodisulfide reductase-related iron-sulfur binding cluster [Methylocapsa palsarum]SFJ98941.1 glycolate oxidase iron-sulfur subunit [Methylocapsa palsarum]